MEKEPTVENTADMVITKAQITTATVIDRYFIIFFYLFIIINKIIKLIII